VFDLTIYNIIGLLLRLSFPFKGERKFRVAEFFIYIFSVELEAVGVNGQLNDLFRVTEISDIEGGA
jgi:hypothetical protein